MRHDYIYNLIIAFCQCIYPYFTDELVVKKVRVWSDRSHSTTQHCRVIKLQSSYIAQRVPKCMSSVGTNSVPIWQPPLTVYMVMPSAPSLTGSWPPYSAKL